MTFRPPLVSLVRDPLASQTRARLRLGELRGSAGAIHYQTSVGGHAWRPAVVVAPAGAPEGSAHVVWLGSLHSYRGQALALAQAVLAGRMRSPGGPRPQEEP